MATVGFDVDFQMSEYEKYLEIMSELKKEGWNISFINDEDFINSLDDDSWHGFYASRVWK